MSPVIAAISRLNCSHHMDHIIPLCELLGGKFVACEESHIELVQKYYPSMPTELIDTEDLSTEFVKEHYDIIIHSFPWPKKLIDYELMPEKKTSRKKIRCIHTPHGNSDKGYYSGIVRNYALQDICLLYGDHMIDMLKKLDVFKDLKDFVIIGNVRYQYYLKHKTFFDKQATEEVFSKLDPKKKTILYAPTWDDFENSTSIYDAYAFVLEELPKEYNLIVKLHPWLGHESIGKVYHIIGKYETTPNVVFLTEYPPIYPLLARSDIYLGDLSSIGYDFLAFDRPMFFFNPNRELNDPSLFLHKCGTTIPLNEGQNILKFIDDGIRRDKEYRDIRKETYRYAFHEDKSFDNIKDELLQKINQ